MRRLSHIRLRVKCGRHPAYLFCRGRLADAGFEECGLEGARPFFRNAEVPLFGGRASGKFGALSKFPWFFDFLGVTVEFGGWMIFFQVVFSMCEEK